MAFEGLTDKLQNAFRKLSSKGKLTEADVKTAMREVHGAAGGGRQLRGRQGLRQKGHGARRRRGHPGQPDARTAGHQDRQRGIDGADGRAERPADLLPAAADDLHALRPAGRRQDDHGRQAGQPDQEKRQEAAARGLRRLPPGGDQQLQVVGGQVGVEVFERGQGDPVQIAKEAVEYARYYGRDPVIIDTAGRLHIDEKLMQELRDVRDTVKPKEILLVVDAMTGQDAVTVAKTFNDELGVDGVILTKLDGDTRGGAAISVRAVTGKPIKFAGVGEKLSDIEPFHPDRMASRILGMGDVLSLIEKAQDSFDEQQAGKLVAKVRTNSFTLEDYLDQMRQISKMGSITDVLKMIPGLGSKLKDVEIDEDKVAKAQKKNEAIILSMTPHGAPESGHPERVAQAQDRRGQRRHRAGSQPAAEAIRPGAQHDEERHGRRPAQDAHPFGRMPKP